MKSIFILLLIEIIYSYDTEKAINYAKKYCKDYNPDYNTYDEDSANFVSQCLIAGGEGITDCKLSDDKNAFQSVANLKSCLYQLGWKVQSGVPRQFKAGYPFFNNENTHVMIATEVNGKTITYCGHTKDSCDEVLENPNKYHYYYKTIIED